MRLADASTATRTACSGTSFGCARAERRRLCELLQLQGGHDDGGAYSPSPYSKRSRAQPSAGRGRYRRMQPARQARPSTASSTWQRPKGRAAYHCARRRSRRCARPSFRRKGSRSGARSCHRAADTGEVCVKKMQTGRASPLTSAKRGCTTAMEALPLLASPSSGPTSGVVTHLRRSAGSLPSAPHSGTRGSWPLTPTLGCSTRRGCCRSSHPPAQPLCQLCAWPRRCCVAMPACAAG